MKTLERFKKAKVVYLRLFKKWTFKEDILWPLQIGCSKALEDSGDAWGSFKDCFGSVICLACKIILIPFLPFIRFTFLPLYLVWNTPMTVEEIQAVYDKKDQSDEKEGKV